MVVTSAKFKDYACFSETPVGLDTFKPITIIIGRNNSGKSKFLDLIERLAYDRLNQILLSAQYKSRFTESDLKASFPQGRSGGGLVGDHWTDNGRKFSDLDVAWHVSAAGDILDLDVQPACPALPRTTNLTSVRSMLESVLAKATSPIQGKKVRRIFAERDVQPETEKAHFELKGDGSGASDVIRKYLNSTQSKYSRDLVRLDLLHALNEIFAPDGNFLEIEIKQHDQDGASGSWPWEVHLSEESKGLIPLSASGSGLKTIILVLLNLLVIPHFEGRSSADYVYCFEELENNLHPALQRRLLAYLERHVEKNKCTLFLTTHSNVVLDFFGNSPEAQLVAVSHDGRSSVARTISAHFDYSELIAELGAKPSDLLQANGVIWVEGPSDRVYINRWIELVSDGELVEGRHYQCACYGGALLARVEFVEPTAHSEERLNLLRLNGNVVVVCDSDRDHARGRLKKRVQTAVSQVREVPNAHVWVTGAREIENYIPEAAIRAFCGRTSIPAPERFQQFFPRKSVKARSYLEQRLGVKTIDKMELASGCIDHMDLANLADRFDLLEEVKKIVELIRMWNS